MELTHVKHRFRGSRTAALLLAAAATLIVTSTASAQTVSPTDDQYDSSLELVSQGGRGPGQAAGPSPAQPGATQPTATQPGGALPFTGLDIAGLLAAAAALGASGLVLRRLTRRHSPSDGQIS